MKTLTSTNIKIYCKNTKTFKYFLLFSIRTNYPELDFTHFLYDHQKILKKEYNQYLFSSIGFLNNYLNLKTKYKNECENFEKILKYHKKNYHKGTKATILGRIGESLNKTIFYRDIPHSVCIFKKLKSKIFESGIDFTLIKFSRIKKNFEYFFFEVKSTIEDIKNCTYKITNWYTLENFTKKYLYELESLKEFVSNSKKLTENDIISIKNDLNFLAINLINKIRPSQRFFFCSSISCEKLQDYDAIIKKDTLIENGFNYIFVIENFYKNIIEVYKCLDIII